MMEFRLTKDEKSIVCRREQKIVSLKAGHRSIRLKTSKLSSLGYPEDSGRIIMVYPKGNIEVLFDGTIDEAREAYGQLIGIL